MRKVSLEKTLYYVQLFLIGVLAFVAIAFQISGEKETFMDRELFSENVLGIQCSSHYLISQKGESVDFQIPETEGVEDFAIYKILSQESDEIVRGIYETDDIFKLSSYVESGRFFEQKDFKSDRATAVIGSSLLSRTYEGNGIRYYGYGDQLYEVIGVFKETGKDIDAIAYLNLNHVLSSMDHYGLYYVDGSSKSAVQSTIGKIAEMAEGKYTLSQVEYEKKPTGLSFMNNVMLFSVLFAMIMNLCITTEYLIGSEKLKVAIKKTCGMTDAMLRKELSKSYFMGSVCSFAAVVVVVYVCKNHLQSFFFSFDGFSCKWMLILAVALCILTIYSTYRSVSQLQKMDLSSQLKGR